METTKKSNEIREIASCLKDVIDTLLYSCTCLAGEGENHEHDLFDNIDKKQLSKINDRLISIIDDLEEDTVDEK